MIPLGKIAAETLEHAGENFPDLVDQGKLPEDCRKFFPEHPVIYLQKSHDSKSSSYMIEYDGQWRMSEYFDPDGDYEDDTVPTSDYSLCFREAKMLLLLLTGSGSAEFKYINFGVFDSERQFKELMYTVLGPDDLLKTHLTNYMDIQVASGVKWR